MTEPAWKQGERVVARKLGGERTPLSGSNSHHTSADAIGTSEYVEHKRRKDDTVHDALTALSVRARRANRWPAIVYDQVRDDGTQLRWVAVWLDRYLKVKRRGWWSPTVRLPPGGPWLLEHAVSRRLAHATLVEDTIEKAQAEGRPPLVIVSVHGSPNRVALVPMDVPRPCGGSAGRVRGTVASPPRQARGASPPLKDVIA